MAVRLHSITFDCADPPIMARFWASVTGYQIGRCEGYFAELSGDGSVGPGFMFLKVPEARSAKNRVHLDLGAEELEGELERLVGLGAVLVARHQEYGVTWAELLDPEGNVFDLALHAPPAP